MAGIENRGPVLSAVSIFFVSMAVVSFTLRAYVRTRMVRAFGVDDWFMLLATIMFILFVTCVNIGVHYGTGRHYVDLSRSDFENAMQVSTCRPRNLVVDAADPVIFHSFGITVISGTAGP